uniref:DUF1084 domain-containing protein n=1 Tax=Meloidogyne hapla TaxID=6305 RepID=A0A1I8BPJ1_MELHA
MVMVQKVTLLAFSLHDGHVEKELSDTQRKESLNPFWAAFRKLSAAFCFGVLIYRYADFSEPEQIISPEAFNMPFYQWLGLFWFVIFMQRAQYYYVWIFSDAICNLSGFGFNGFTEEGDPKWDKITNVDAWKVEVCVK